MENAVKALMITAGILIGIMILSLGVTLFSSMGEYTGTAQQRIDENAVQAFNEKFTRYVNAASYTEEPEFTLTIQDVVSAANTAYESNTNYGLTAPSNNNYYVTIKMPGEDKLEQVINEKSSKILKENISKKYKCTLADVKVRQVTGRVYELTFFEANY